MRQPSLGRLGDEDVARSIALNQHLSDIQDDRRAREQSLRAMRADADTREAVAKQAAATMEDRATIDRAAAMARNPQGVIPAEIVRNADWSYTSRGTGPVADPRQVFAENLPGHLQPVEKPLTFEAPKPVMVGGKRVFGRMGSDGRMYDMSRKPIDPSMLAPETEADKAGVSAESQVIDPPTDPNSQDIMSQAGLSHNAFQVLTGNMSKLPRDKATRDRASKEVEQWARSRGMDVSTLASQYKASNEVLEANIQRYNRTQMAEGEIKSDVENLLGAAKESGLTDVRAINAAKQWLKGELNDPNAAQYAFFLNQLTNDIALYNAASQGRAPLQADLEEAKSVVQRGISTGSLTGMQDALTKSVEKMGVVLEGGVNRARKDVWTLFGVGDKFKPVTRDGTAPPAAPDAKPKNPFRK